MHLNVTFPAQMSRMEREWIPKIMNGVMTPFVREAGKAEVIAMIRIWRQAFRWIYGIVTGKAVTLALNHFCFEF